MGEIDFEDVIFTARVMAFPEKAVMEIRRLREEGYRLTQKLAQAQVDLEEARKLVQILADLRAEDNGRCAPTHEQINMALVYLSAHPADPKADSTGQNGN